MTSENQKGRGMAADVDAAKAHEDGQTTPAELAAKGDGDRPGTTDVQAYIGRQLRAVYDDVVKQPIPDRFLALMKQLEEQGPQG